MRDKKFVLPDQESITISGQAAGKLIRSGDKAAALLYIYILKNKGSISPSAAYPALDYGEKEFYDAVGTLTRLGLIKGEDEPRELPAGDADELPEYTSEEIGRAMDGASDFSPLVKEVQAKLGRVLNTNDLKTLLGIYDHLGMPSDVILLLISYCIEEHREKYGEGRIPTMRGVEKVAYIWARNEILSMDEALEYLKKRSAQKSELENVRKALKIRNELTATQKKYIFAWLDMGITLEGIELAYDRTVVNTGELKWPYMNKILTTWHQKGLHTPEEIEKGDVRKPVKKQPVPDKGEMERKRKLLKNIMGE